MFSVIIEAGGRKNRGAHIKDRDPKDAGKEDKDMNLSFAQLV